MIIDDFCDLFLSPAANRSVADARTFFRGLSG